MKVLVTGGAGYIGSTTCAALEEAGHVPVVLDSLHVGPRAFVGDRIFYEGDVADRALLRRVVADHPDLACTVHMAARTIVTESVADPATYYRENVAKSLELVDELLALGLPRLVFSSSASLYALPEDGFEVTESSPLAPGSPYARTKLMVEQILEDLAAATPLRALSLRYFNPIGSDPALRTGVHGPAPTHVVGQLVRTATGGQEVFRITGTDLPTRDGTGVRDYIHVWDLARAHVAAVERLDAVLDREGASYAVLNVGTGRDVTVRELVERFSAQLDHPLEVVDAPARPGDAVGAFANVDRIQQVLGWEATATLDDALASALAWGRRRREVLGYA